MTGTGKRPADQRRARCFRVRLHQLHGAQLGGEDVVPALLTNGHPSIPARDTPCTACNVLTKATTNRPASAVRAARQLNLDSPNHSP